MVLKNEFLQQQRKRKRETLNNEKDILKTQQDVLEGLIEQEERKQLFKEIQNLPSNMKEILIESVYFQMSDNDIAKIFKEFQQKHIKNFSSIKCKMNSFGYKALKNQNNKPILCEEIRFADLQSFLFYDFFNGWFGVDINGCI